MTLKPRQESAKTTFRNDLLARGLLSNQLRYRQLRPHRPVKRVETETVITHVAIGRVQPGQIHLSAGPGGSPTGKHVTPGPQSPATGTGRSDTCVDMCKILTLMEGATLATSSNRRKPECPGRHFSADL